jgi:uncharacterized protein YidB (DUF937 family)
MLLDSLHLQLSPLLSLAAASGGLWLLSRRSSKPAGPRPTNSFGWLERCEAALSRFERLELSDGQAQGQRRHRLDQLRRRQQRQHLELALVGTALPNDQQCASLAAQCRSLLPLQLHRAHPLPATSTDWQWPWEFRCCDQVLYGLDLPLKAVDLRWLETLPAQQPVWLLIHHRGAAEPSAEALRQLEGQLPERFRRRWLLWQADAREELQADLAPLQRALAATAGNQLEATQRRCLEELHGQWQVELEALRRQQWRGLLQRTQWTVAAGVVVAPLPSLDLLVLTVANGLMLQEMARLWDCPWGLEQLQAAASELAKAALTLGVVEWSSQALAAVVKLHAATWLVGGALQALSAAYLTRVIGHAMADAMALSVGVPEAELQALLQRQAPLLVARAAEQEKLDWPAFLQQGCDWLAQQSFSGPAEGAAAL